jgi:Peptidase inhibitor family I36
MAVSRHANRTDQVTLPRKHQGWGSGGSRTRRDKRELPLHAIFSVFIALGMSGVVVAGVGGAAAAQAQQVCEPGQVCLYEDAGFLGPVWGFLADTYILDPAIDNKASSAVNASPGAVRLYRDINYGEPSICLNPNTAIDNLTLVGLNDDISSIRMNLGPTC